MNNKKLNAITNVNYKQLTEEFTPLSCYILGLLWANGHITSKYNGISLATTYPDAEHFIKIFKQTGNWRVHNGKKWKESWKQPCTIGTSNYIISEFLKANDYLSKSWLSADKILNKIPENLHSYWFSGLLDGDGCIEVYQKKGQKYAIVFSSGHNQDWLFLEELCNKLCINFSIYRKITKNGNYSQFAIYGIQKSLKFLDFIYKNNNFKLNRKFEKYLELQKIFAVPRYKGICYDNSRKKWRVYSKTTGKLSQKHIGFFDTESEAILARNQYLASEK